jgi:serine/threonine-protein kinase
MAALCTAILDRPAPSARAVRPEVPEALDAILRRCLAKNRADRFASIGDLAEALEPFACEAISAATVITRSKMPVPDPPVRRSLFDIGIVVAGIGLLVSMATWIVSRAPTSTQTLREEQVVAAEMSAAAPAPSPDVSPEIGSVPLADVVRDERTDPEPPDQAMTPPRSPTLPHVVRAPAATAGSRRVPPAPTASQTVNLPIAPDDRR